MTGGFPSQRASNAENVSISWRHHVILFTDNTDYSDDSHCHIGENNNNSDQWIQHTNWVLYPQLLDWSLWSVLTVEWEIVTCKFHLFMHHDINGHIVIYSSLLILSGQVWIDVIWIISNSKDKKTLFNVGIYKQITLVSIRDGH